MYTFDSSGIINTSGHRRFPFSTQRTYLNTPRTTRTYSNLGHVDTTNNIFSNRDYTNIFRTSTIPNITYETWIRGDQFLNDFDVSGAVSDIISEVQRYLDASDTTHRGTNVQNLYDNMTLSVVEEQYVNNPDFSCVVCLREYDEGDIIRKFNSCSHFFHANCIERWLCQHDCCPTCRTSLSS